MTRKRVSDFCLECYRLGELDAAAAAAVAELIASDGLLGARLAALERSDAEILSAYPPRDMAAALLRRLAAATPSAARIPR